MDIYDIIDNIYKLPLASKEALLNETPEVTYPKGFHLFLANRKSSKFYLMKKGMLHAYTYKSDKKVTFWFGKEGDAIFPLQTLYNNQAGYENIELLEDSVLYELSVDKLHDLYLADIHIARRPHRGLYHPRFWRVHPQAELCQCHLQHEGPHQRPPLGQGVLGRQRQGQLQGRP